MWTIWTYDAAYDVVHSLNSQELDFFNFYGEFAV